ncbi:hypothetical protein J3R82DRAFT_10498 [Butyriboletus roseoflavus]|nr:hypothetical protein J3R82DRAFT_10498 [Butyriboletus roseoflavus]
MSLLTSLPNPPHNRSSPLDGSLTTAGQNLNRDPSARPTRLACSSVDLLWVMSYAPGEGDQGTPISVNFTCKADLALDMNIRLVVGRRAVGTHVHAIDNPRDGRWQLTGHAPSFLKQASSSPMVPLTIQAVDKENHVVDSVTFGDFVYHHVGSCLACPSSSSTSHMTFKGGAESSSPNTSPAAPSHPNLRIVSGEAVDRSSKRRSPYSQPQSPPSSDSENGSSQGSRPHIQLITPALRRASRQLGSEPEDTTQTVILDITTPLDTFCFDWEESELHAGRRLDGNRLIVSAERISQAEYDTEDIVISCIYREETDSCCVTSVDIIHLLQRLVDADFEVDEKNRIRRNLEGLRPTTVSKTRPGFESFFQRIMDFPEPKPRKIEKDVKVFDWKLLPHALDKILSKYSLYDSPTPSSPKDRVPSPSFSTSLLQETSAGGAVSAYGDNPSQLQHEHKPHLDALYLSQTSPVIQLPSFANECSPDSPPEIHRRPSLHEEQLQSLYLDTEIMQRYYPDPDIPYGVPPSSASLQSPMYTAESSAVLPRDTSTFIGDPAQHEWVTQPTNDAMLVSPQEPIYSHAYGYSQSDSLEPADIYVTPSHPINRYDSFEFQTLRDSAALASQHA